MAKIVALLAVVLGGCAQLEGLIGGGKDDPLDFGFVDVDGDANVSTKELTNWGKDQGMFSMLGGVDGILDPLDLASGLYGLWNIEGDGITEAEFNQGITSWFPDMDAGDYTDWDLNADNMLDENELQAGFAHTGIATEWDGDENGDISENEAYTAIYEVFDIDRDNRVDKTEWKNALTGWRWNF